MQKKKKTFRASDDMEQRDHFFYGIKIIWDVCAEFDTRMLFLTKRNIFSVLTENLFKEAGLWA